MEEKAEHTRQAHNPSIIEYMCVGGIALSTEAMGFIANNPIMKIGGAVIAAVGFGPLLVETYKQRKVSNE